MERRVCNSFSCKGTVNTIAVEDSRYFKPYRRSFQSVHDRPGAWRIKAGSYFLLPYHQVFGKHFPHDFTIFLTFKPYKDTEGVILSLNDPSTRQEYLSLELSKTKGHHLKMVHSTHNGTRVVSIPAPIRTNNWNQLSISVEDGSSIRTYLDCNWVTTQILHGHALAVPPKPDLIIGYMFQGEIEQLTVSDAVGEAGEQCSSSRLPLQDDSMEEEEEKEEEEEEEDSMSALRSSVTHHRVTVRDPVQTVYPWGLLQAFWHWICQRPRVWDTFLRTLYFACFVWFVAFGFVQCVCCRGHTVAARFKTKKRARANVM